MTKIQAFEFVSPDNWRFLNNAEVQQAAIRAAEYETRNFNFDYLEHRIEEYLRQWMTAQLIEVYGYPEAWLWLANTSKRNANLVIKNEANQSLALIAARYFGDSDVEFEQAAQNLQSDLEEIGTVNFGIVTDGRRISFLCKSQDENIGDYKNVADFPTYRELKSFVETNQLLNLSPLSNRFQKLPPRKITAKPRTSGNPIKNSQSFFSSLLPKRSINSKNKTARQSKKPAIRAGFALIVLTCMLLLGLSSMYSRQNSSASSSNAGQGAITNSLPDKNSSPLNSVSDSQSGKPLTPAPPIGFRPAAPKPRKNSGSTVYESNPDGTLKLNSSDASMMQTRPAANPNPKIAPPKVFSKPSATELENQPTNRKIIRQPFTQTN